MEKDVTRKPRGYKITSRKPAETGKRKYEKQPVREGRKIGYMRVSTKEQDLDLQYDALIGEGVRPEDIFQDKISGKTKSRPGLDACKKFMVKGDMLIVWRLDRLGRSIIMLQSFVQELLDKDVTFKSLRENLDLSTPAGRAMFGMMCVFAQMEREVISERVTAGIKSKMDAGRPRWGKEPATDYKTKDVKRLIRQGMSQRAIAEQIGISKATVQRIGKTVKKKGNKNGKTKNKI